MALEALENQPEPLCRSLGGFDRAGAGYRCVDCGSMHDLTLDHLVPLAVEVRAHCSDDELVTRCRRCNSRRRERLEALTRVVLATSRTRADT